MIKVRIERSFTTDGYGLWIIDYDLQGRKTRIATPTQLEFREYGETRALPEPTFNLPMHSAMEYLRAFNDALSEAEIQSSKQERRDREISVLRQHLADATVIRDRLLKLIEEKL